jgi:ketosteroid isomerase-like protein
MANNKKPVHVTPRHDGWAVTREGNDRASSVHRTQKEAEKKGRQTARKDKTEFYLHIRQGQIRERDSYGNDPYPPKG